MSSQRQLRRRSTKTEDIDGGQAKIAEPTSSASEDNSRGKASNRTEESASAKPSSSKKTTKRAAVAVDPDSMSSQRQLRRRSTKTEDIDGGQAKIAEPTSSASEDNSKGKLPNRTEESASAKPSSSKKKTKRAAVAVDPEAMPSQRKLCGQGTKTEEIDGGEAKIAEPSSSASENNSKRKAPNQTEEDASAKPTSSKKKTKRAAVAVDPDVQFLGAPIPPEEATERWPERYAADKRKAKKGSNAENEEEKEVLYALRHYAQAHVDGCVFHLNDDACIKGEDGGSDYIGKIVEFFESTDKKPYFKARWFFKAEDTVIKNHAHLIDRRRLFYSDLTDDNPLECIISKLRIVRIAPNIDLATREATLLDCDFYYDMSYSLQYSTFASLPEENVRAGSETSTISDVSSDEKVHKTESNFEECVKQEMTLLDLYSGCGAMSTGLCLGAKLFGVNLVTRWAVDLNSHACESLKLNHPGTEVRNESADNFLKLLKEWEKLCREFSVLGISQSHEPNLIEPNMDENNDDDSDEDSEQDKDSEIFEVEKLIGICYGDPNEKEELGLYFKVRWKGYGPSEDTWEPMQGLSDCRERIQEFVTHGYKSKILPLPGDVHVICGGPPCQGASGFNRFRNTNAPLEDEKNQQLIVFMDIVDYLKPKFVLMENVVDILKFAGGFLGRYALGRLVAMNYQARLGMLAAGCYGLPQFRMRVFLWGASPYQALPQYPLPTHDVVVRGVIPQEFEQNVVAYDKDQSRNLEKALYLGDAISDLPEVTNDETRDEMPYGRAACTKFQKHIRLSMQELMEYSMTGQMVEQNTTLYDHRPLKLNDDDYQRVCQIPKRKGANFRDLPGVKVGPDNKVEWDESIKRVLLPSGKPLVPDYAMSFVRGTSSKPFARLWWDETVPTVVTRAEPHNQQIIHPTQDRVVRENARLQGFPDCYKLCGPVKERYIQVGNAVAVPVSRALGYALGMASKGTCGENPVFKLPPTYPNCLKQTSSTASEDDADS